MEQADTTDFEYASRSQQESIIVFGKALSTITLAYLTCPTDAQNQYLGGLLLTDWRTRPKEFAYVNPVKISTMQRIIHGKTLQESIQIDVIAAKLLNEASIQPNVIFVDNDILLPLQAATSIPVVKLAMREVNDTSISIAPLTYRAYKPGHDIHEVGEFLTLASNSIDLFDPFQRLTEAIREALKSTTI